MKVFGQVRHSTRRDSKEYINVKFLSGKILKAKEQMKEQNKESTIAKLDKYKEKVANGKDKPQEKKEVKKNDREM